MEGSPLRRRTESTLSTSPRHSDNNYNVKFILAISVLAVLAVVSFAVLLSSDSRQKDLGFTSDTQNTSHIEASFQSLKRLAGFFPAKYTEPVIESYPKRSYDKLEALNWVSKRDPPPGFEKWLKFARDNKCHLGSYLRIEKDLESFRDPQHPSRIRITKEKIQQAAGMVRTTMVSIRNGSMNAALAGSGFLSANEFTQLMSRFVKDLPDMDFVMNHMDEPRVLPGTTSDVDARFASSTCANASESFLKYRHLHGFVNNRQTGPTYDPNMELVPLFSQSKINECHRDITYPTLYGVGSALPREDEEKLIPWEQRKSDIFFRGSTTGGSFAESGKYRLAHRQRLVSYAKGKSNMDFALTAFIQCSGPVCAEMEAEYGNAPRIEYIDNFKHKYLMSLDGNTFVSRLPRFFTSASMIFRAGLFSEWFDEWIHEGEHYMQVALDYSDLEEKVQWAIQHDDKAREIGLAGREFSKHRLRNEDMECYLYRLLLEYAAVVY